MTLPTAAAAARGGQRQQRLLIGLLCGVGIVSAFTSTMLVSLVSRLTEIYDVGAVGASWIVTSTLLAGALATPIVSRMADLYGKRKMMVLTLVLMTLGSVLLALTTNYVVAISGRALQGISAALLPVSLSLMKDALPAHRVGFGVALVTGTLGIGSAAGLPIAGILYAQLGWSSLFWVDAALSAALALALYSILPGSRMSRERFDWIGSIVLTLALTPMLLVIAQGNEWGWTSPGILTLAVTSAVLFAVWVPWELRHAHPLVRLDLLALRPVALSNIATIVISLAMIINLYLASQQLSTPTGVPGGLGLSAEATGLLMALPAAAVAAVSPLAGGLLSRYGGRMVMALGALVMCASYVARVWLDDSPFEVTLGAVLVCIGTGLAIPATPMIIMGAVPPEHSAGANGINALCRQVGSAVSIAGLAAVTAVTSVRFEGAEYPTTQTYHISFWACAALQLVSALLILLVPRERVGGRRPSPLAQDDAVPMAPA